MTDAHPNQADSAFTVRLRRFLSRHWLTLLVGFAGVVATAFFAQKAISKRQPVFVVDPNRIQIIDRGRVASAPIRVLRSDGTEISRDLVAVRFYLWNAGTEPIRPEDVLSPIRVSVTDSAASIIDFKVVAVARDVVHAELARDSAPQALRVGFLIFEEGDGMSGQIVYEGDPQADLRIDGEIVGVSSITTPGNLGWTSIAARTIKAGGLLILGAAGMTLFLGFSNLAFDWLAKRFIPEKVWRVIQAGFAVLILLLVLIGVAIVGFSRTREQNTEYLVGEVPTTLVGSR